MSGTGPTPAEQHLGDRLAALVDGELTHDVRDRVLAHLATCARCKSEAAAQRRLKSVFAQSAPPSPSEGFLARLQGLPGGPGGDDDGQGRPFGGAGRFADGIFPVIPPSGSRSDSPSGKSPLERFGYLPTPHGAAAVLPGSASGSAFRIHEVGRDADRSPWRGRRFVFAAASAVSLAAIALGGALPTDSGSDTAIRAEGAGNNATPLDAASRAESAGATSRRSGGPHGNPAAPDSRLTVATPLRQPNGLVPAVFGAGPTMPNPFVASVLTDGSAPPLIRPTATSPLFTRALGSGLPPVAAASPAPSPTSSWTPTTTSAMPSSADHALPLSARR
ncbi:anti-sigma factor family protein [Streptomyces sp. NBC_00316]|uniref:anti-sigma factor family protein n=1 Tax=Streptomyces sp. NBC_00316 TaxID=2975710 RepID=UPI002E2A7B00|nr:zf-HC2 domain-containing protein [Streptomyces sp. NBC_00316]